MNEIRFNPPQRREERVETKEKAAAQPTGGLRPRAIAALFGLVFLAALASVWGFKFGFRSFQREAEPAGEVSRSSSPFSAVFLANGQVYFGKIEAVTSEEVRLSDVFYLQQEKSADRAENTGEEPKATLVKLGQELHGPTNEMFINRSQMLFYENLRDDSKIVEAIKNYK